MIGIDPDSSKFGVAVWVNGNLDDLLSCTIIDLVDIIDAQRFGVEDGTRRVTFVIEDVQANSFIYRQKVEGKKLQAANKIAQCVGMCKQAQVHAEAFILDRGFNLIKQRPTKGNWAKDKPMFERITGWKGRSNEDNRSAAFIAFLHLQKTAK